MSVLSFNAHMRTATCGVMPDCPGTAPAHAAPTGRFWAAIASCATAGDILMFLTGQSEIEKACHKINEAVAALPPSSCQDLLVLPIYAALPPELQVGQLVWFWPRQ